MDPFHPRLSDLPEEFPVFPLAGALLLPGGRLPLNIFEPRFLALTEAALARGRLFGMMLPDPAHPRVDGQSTIFSVGCLGRIASFAETGDGRYLITLLGLIRFRVRRELAVHPRGYRSVSADFSPYAADLGPVEASPAGIDRPRLLAAMRTYFQARRMEVDWEAVEGLSLPVLVTTLCMICPFGGAEKQALLEALDLRERATLLLALMRMDAAGPAAGARPS
ncbi:LON peptidase substrate-binding domain-containing protein [Teichococcus aerofrigidensis]